MKQTIFWRCFLTEDKVLMAGLKHLTEKATALASLTRVRVVVDHTMPTPLLRSTKLKNSHWYFDQSLPHQDFIFCQKHLEQAFFYISVIFSLNSHPFNEMLESLFHWLSCLKFLFKLVTFSKSYARKTRADVFFWTQCMCTEASLAVELLTFSR